MPNINPTGPSKPGEQKPHDIQTNKTVSKPESEGGEKYLGCTFASHKAYVEFKSKFLARMANEMLRQIQKESEKMVQALKKMREDQQ